MCLTAVVPEIGNGCRNSASVSVSMSLQKDFYHFTSEGGNFLIASVSFRGVGSEVGMW